MRERDRVEWRLRGRQRGPVRSGAGGQPDGAFLYLSGWGDRLAVLARTASGRLIDPGGCTSATGSDGTCAQARELGQPEAVAVSPDGANPYASSYVGSALTVFERDPASGAVAQLAGTAGCVSDTGSGGRCADAVELWGAAGLVVSPNGARVYVAAYESDAVVAFARDAATGVLTQSAGTDGCVSETGSGGLCADGQALDTAGDINVSPDGEHVYVTSYSSNAVAVFERDTTSGALTQLPGTAGCVSDTGSGGACTVGRGLGGAADVRAAPDGRHVYVVSHAADAVAVFARAPARSAGGLDGPWGLALSSDGSSVTPPASDGDAMGVFARDTATGALTQSAGTAGCVSETGGGGCALGRGLDSADLYVAAPGSGAIVTLHRTRWPRLPAAAATGC